MRLSTKSTYGLRAMLDIALNEKKGVTPIADIFKTEGISQDYLEQLLNRLRKSGLVRSVRGPKGGYVLARDASRITVADIVRLLEGNIYPVHCVTVGKNAKNICKRTESCVPKIVWAKLAGAIDKCLESITLRDLCVEAKKLGRREAAKFERHD